MHGMVGFVIACVLHIQLIIIIDFGRTLALHGSRPNDVAAAHGKLCLSAAQPELLITPVSRSSDSTAEPASCDEFR